MLPSDIRPKYGSIIFGQYETNLRAYDAEYHVLTDLHPPHVLEELLEKRIVQTQSLQQQPQASQEWITRSVTHLKLHYPELAASDAYKALLLLQQLPLANRTAQTILLRSRAALILCQSLFFAQSFTECLHYIATFRSNSQDGIQPLDPGYLTKLRRLRSFALQCNEGERKRLSDNSDSSDDHDFEHDIEEAMKCGEIYAARYPWMETRHAERKGDSKEKMSAGVLEVSRGACALKTSQIPEAMVQHCYGVYATKHIRKEEIIFEEVAALAATDMPCKGLCGFCCVVIENHETLAGVQGYCSALCQKNAQSSYGRGSSFQTEKEAIESITQQLGVAEDHPDRSRTVAQERLRYRTLMSMVRQVRLSVNNSLHSLDASPIDQLVGYASAPKEVAFSFWEDVQLPLSMLRMLEVDIFADHRFDTWVLLTVSGRIDLNAWEYKQELPDGTETFVTGLNSCYSLFNHSCDPNVEWFRDDVTGRIVFRALEDIEIGEEMFSSYLSDQQLEQSTEKRLETLKSWMGDGPHFCTRCFPELVDNRDVEMTDA